MRFSPAVVMIAAVSFLMMSAFVGCGDMPQPPARPKHSDAADKPVTREKPAVPTMIEINPDKLDAKKRAVYDKGYAQGQKIVAKDVSDGRSAENIMKDRDLAIQMALQFSAGDESDNDVLLACGRKAAAKDFFAKGKAGGK